MSRLIIFFIFFLSINSIMFQEEKYKIICFGDSITYGAGVEGKGWVEQIANKSDKINIINEGRKGRKTSDKEELITILESNSKINLVTILLGVNDLKNGNDSLVNLCVENIKWMIKRIKEKDPSIKILLISPCNINLETISDINKKKLYNENTVESLIKLEERYRKLAEEEGIYFTSLFNIVSPPNFLDGLHPNLEGHKEIAEKLWIEIKKILELN